MSAPESDALRALSMSLTTGEHSAAESLGRFLADGVTMVCGAQSYSGRHDVLARLSGQWATTFALRHVVWADPADDGGRVRMAGDIHGQPAWAPAGIRMDVSFDAAKRLDDIVIEFESHPRPDSESVIPALARATIDNARVREHPMCLAYVDADGVPVQTFRGSVQVFDDTQLCAWIRNPEGGLARSIAVNPQVSLTYQDSPGHSCS